MPASDVVVLFYLALINLLSTGLALYDKRMAKRKKWRIPEKTFPLCVAAGGALFLFFTMLLIRHKTRHLKFMAGLPALIMIHSGILIWLYTCS